MSEDRRASEKGCGMMEEIFKEMPLPRGWKAFDPHYLMIVEFINRMASSRRVIRETAVHIDGILQISTRLSLGVYRPVSGFHTNLPISLRFRLPERNPRGSLQPGNPRGWSSVTGSRP
ncbi:MAG TPA: hypothetical protein PLF04_08815 [Candidatus Fermentibacter daniensis]|jgi:hypothetical protein|nr:hypothetical protein [Candidatus Fermentibacter sp.]NLI02347.1 hypothetical protein [Candidatus Fermentibacter daniensis]MCC6871232.1 hypothetical protein [Candidatus Fermentibacter sp.]HOA05602.1 hypothetical protein [Candidatus Fermentibacter daniensis]HOG55378.1 hypothetical protein [Candidatus Fermentibacter daniensis]